MENTKKATNENKLEGAMETKTSRIWRNKLTELLFSDKAREKIKWGFEEHFNSATLLALMTGQDVTFTVKVKAKDGILDDVEMNLGADTARPILEASEEEIFEAVKKQVLKNLEVQSKSGGIAGMLADILNS